MTDLREARKHFLECLVMLEYDPSATDESVWCEDKLESLTNEAFWTLVNTLQEMHPEWLHDTFHISWSIYLEYGEVGGIYLEGGDCAEDTLLWITDTFGFIPGHDSLCVR